MFNPGSFCLLPITRARACVRGTIPGVRFAAYFLAVSLLSTFVPTRAWSVITYNETDTAGVTNNFGCGGNFSNVASGRTDLTMSQGGTAGTATRTVTLDPAMTGVAYTLISPAGVPNSTSWAAGTWTVGLHFTDEG